MVFQPKFLAMKTYLFVIMLVMAMILSGCDKVKESPLLFEFSSNIDEQAIWIGYHTEDSGPTLYPKQKSYFIDTKIDCEGDLLLTCTNCNNLGFTAECGFGVVDGTIGKDIPATEEQIGVSIELSGNNALNIHFDKLSEEDLPLGFLCVEAVVKVYWKVGGKDVMTKITIHRSKPIQI